MVLVNDSPSSFFKVSRGMKQGDPLYPLLFIMTLDKLLPKIEDIQFFRRLEVGEMGEYVEMTYLFLMALFCSMNRRYIFDNELILLCFRAIFELNVNIGKSKLV